MTEEKNKKYRLVLTLESKFSIIQVRDLLHKFFRFCDFGIFTLFDVKEID